MENLKKEKTNQVSFYISVAQKISLDFDVIYYKNLNTEEGKKRNTINKNISFILEAFVDKYINMNDFLTVLQNIIKISC